MKKKLIALMLMICLLATSVLLVACDLEESPAEPAATTPAATTPSSSSSSSKPVTAKSLETELSNAITKTEDLNDIDMSYVIKIKMEMPGVTIDMPINMVMQAKNMDSNDPIMYMSMEYSVMGEEYTMINYHENGWDYTVDNGESYKTESSVSADDEDEDSTDNPFMTDLSDKDILDMDKLTYTNNADGSRTVTVSVDNEKFQEVFAEAMEWLDEFAMMGDDGEITISDATVDYTIKNGYVVSYNLKYTMTMTIDGVTTVCYMEADTEIKNPGKPVTITPPAGYRNFEEYDPMGDFDF